MKFDRLLEIVGDEPVFEAGLLAGDVNPGDVRRQLSRWVDAGRLYQVRRGLYALAPPFQKVRPHPFLIADHLVRGSYVSLQSALAHYNLIPEYVPVTTSVSPDRPYRWDIPLGSYLFRHLRKDLLTGYHRMLLAEGQEAFVATPEKALLDLLYLELGADTEEYLNELRLQHLETLDLDELSRLAGQFGKPKLLRAADRVARIAETGAAEYQPL